MADKELSKGKQLEKELCWEYPNIAKKAPEQREKAHEFAKGYMEFLGSCKTERECVKFAEKMFLEAGYERFDSKKKYKAGDKVFSTNRGKAMAITVFGTRSLADGVRINGAHIDSPRIDLRPNPLYESNDIALFKTHYYGGIKKYQWGSMPLAMHGVVVKKDGTTVEITIGEDPSDPVLYITDLLIHLSKQQMQRPLSEGLRGEELNIVLGTTPYPDEDVKEPFRLEVLRYLNEKYGITERDFARAEIEFVPAAKPRDIGLARWSAATARTTESARMRRSWRSLRPKIRSTRRSRFSPIRKKSDRTATPVPSRTSSMITSATSHRRRVWI